VDYCLVDQEIMDRDLEAVGLGREEEISLEC
jgi:hypothetical protein